MVLLDSHDDVRIADPADRRRLFASSRLRGAGTDARRSWQSTYVRRVVVADLLCALAAALIGYVVRFGPQTLAEGHVPFWVVVVLPLAWVGAMLVSRSYEQRFLWIGSEEFRRVFFAAMLMLAAVGTVSWAFKLDLARGFIVAALPLATVATLLTRYLIRSRLHRARGRGLYQQTAVLVGHRNGVAALKEQIEREKHHGYTVVGCLLPGGHTLPAESVFAGVPVLGGFDDVVAVVERFSVDTVAVLPSPELDGPALRRLGWDLEQTQAELLLAPAITEIAGPRVRIRPVCGLPLLHMEKPDLRGIRRVAKDTVDRTSSALALLFMLPMLLGIAAAVGLTSRGGVFYRQERVGRDGQTFSMLKFRSMVAGADAMTEHLAGDNDGNGVLFKQKSDVRVTRVGRALRRYSLDELPQLLNVVRGDMSLVGPRPPLPSEVERYGFDMHRRFLVKPGITGLWQISGRSDLSWDDSVRIDVRYVENWSLTFDFMILWKTVGAVLRGSGAY
ncbi:Undecaprenyl-phosphate galactose phosphotransferase, WbaP/exopolysaccharide biosynthesis polyprenyl glycosylphosphotransferase [Klenkia soli]|uniref:Undecaprenyl-phosphate galactose phosphotransferase, WbaP/exopolysaccharide biosynthesis polyprenyl glycosylphosphotransferase n=1 Tax=Klenkia soli TaxID=1052260 RepID=A0A1H0UTD2_9ACTN|nr:sugar transferase [Klenkia soli]SDP69430.1 Undecaprenyl-phosphate galactose phosphotransferase, WbaP/exopolysaccharide biosynthesis polyprenyl glycosylphosphotransferase [Klenkia soli]